MSSTPDTRTGGEPVVLSTEITDLRAERHDWGLRVAGLRYAAPPTGDRRFRPAAPPEPPLAQCPAERVDTAPPQRQGRSLWTRPVGAIAEDCLLLNVHTPDPAGRAPVLVWIFGGGFVNGSAADALLAPATLCRAGLLLVTFNYRLGLFGWCDGAEPVGSDNLALDDQIAALRWVREHIHHFGGDRDRVTLAGESAGAMSIGALLAAPAARALFRSAILQSGGAESTQSPARAAHVAAAVATAQAAPGARTDTEGWLDVQAAAAAALQPRLDGMPYMPVAPSRLLPQEPIRAIAAGAAPPVPLIVGWNRDEQRLYLNPRRPIDAAELHARVTRQLHRLRLRRVEGRDPDIEPRAADADLAVAAERLIDGYRTLRPEHADHPLALWCAIVTDARFRLPALRLALRHAGPVHVYEFRWASPALRGWLGACHALEVPFIFDSFAVPGIARFTGHDASARPLVHAMQADWIAFAATGAPAAAAWRPWSDTERPLRVFDRAPAVEAAGTDAELALWREVLADPLLRPAAQDRPSASGRG